MRPGSSLGSIWRACSGVIRLVSSISTSSRAWLALNRCWAPGLLGSNTSGGRPPRRHYRSGLCRERNSSYAGEGSSAHSSGGEGQPGVAPRGLVRGTRARGARATVVGDVRGHVLGEHGEPGHVGKVLSDAAHSDSITRCVGHDRIGRPGIAEPKRPQRTLRWGDASPERGRVGRLGGPASPGPRASSDPGGSRLQPEAPPPRWPRWLPYEGSLPGPAFLRALGKLAEQAPVFGLLTLSRMGLAQFIA